MLALSLDRAIDYDEVSVAYGTNSIGETIKSTFARFALPITWDLCRRKRHLDTTGGFGNPSLVGFRMSARV